MSEEKNNYSETGKRGRTKIERRIFSDLAKIRKYLWELEDNPDKAKVVSMYILYTNLGRHINDRLSDS